MRGDQVQWVVIGRAWPIFGMCELVELWIFIRVRDDAVGILVESPHLEIRRGSRVVVRTIQFPSEGLFHYDW